MVPLNFKVPPVSANRSSLDVARGYLAAGIPTFPCHEATIEELDSSTGEFILRPEKSPRNSNGLNGASTTPRIIEILFGQRHPNALIGVPTGEPLGAFVLDLDRHDEHDGHVWLAQMEEEHGPLPATARATTANNGTHIFFEHVPGLTNRAAIAPGADIRSTGGYIIAPGSIMADGRAYRWVDWEQDGLPPIAPAPAWLLDMLKSKPAPEHTGNYTPSEGDNERYVEAAIRGEIDRLVSTRAGRNQAINETAFSLGTLVGAGMLSRAEAEGHIMAAAHANGYIAKDGERAARQTMKSGMDSGIKSPRQIQPREGANDNTRSVPVEGMIAKTIEKQKAKAPEREHSAQANANAPVQEHSSAAAPRVRERFEKTWFDEIKEGEPKVFIIKGAFGEREFTTVSGLPGTGKSVIVTDAACHVATGREWHGHKVKQGLVVYVAAERKKLTERRMMAFRKHHGVHDVPLLVIGGRLDFTSSLKDAKDLIAAVKEAELETGLTCVWVIIDTLTRVFGAGDQNASKDMSRFVQSCDEILAETSAHVTAIHHSAWSGERGKGAIDLDGAVDASFMVKKAAGGKYKLVCDGTNDGEEGDVVNFTMTGIVLGQDEDGEDTTAPVVVTAAPDKPPVSGGPNGINATVLAALGRAVAAHGIEPDGPAFPDGVLVVNEETWRLAFYETDKEAKEDTLKKRFGRGRKSLLEEGAVRQIGQWYWLM